MVMIPTEVLDSITQEGVDRRAALKAENERLRRIENAAWAVWEAVEYTNDHTQWFKPLSGLKAALDASVADDDATTPPSGTGEG